MLEVENVTTRFRSRRGVVHAVNGVSFRVGSSEIVGIVGESGCGKSATIRSVLGLIQPPGEIVGGRAVFDGTDLLAIPAGALRRLRGSEIGFVAQNPFGSLNPILSVAAQFHNLIVAHRGRLSRKQTRDMALQALQSVGISGPERVLDGYAHELSGGMAQRVVIGMATVLGPRLLVADEPTTALDMTIQRQILDLLQDLVRKRERSMILVTHDLGVVAQYCDRVVVMYAGKVIETGPTAQVFARPAHPYTQALLGSVPRRGEEIGILAGRVPSLIDYPPGCAFSNRCVHALDRCARIVPASRPVAGEDGWNVSCHLVSGDADPLSREEDVRAHRAG